MENDANTIHAWLKAMRESIQQQDLEGHMALVSKRVQVYGMPKKEIIDYSQWSRRRQNEFNKHKLLAMQHSPVRIKNLNLRRLAFNVDETLIANDGFVCIVNKDIMLEKEEDDHWRVVEETIRHWSNKQIQPTPEAHE